MSTECKVICHIDKWCMCESVQTIEFDIKKYIKDLSREDKIRYFEKLSKAIKDIKKLELQQEI